MQKRIRLGQTMNLRDLGGYPTKDGRVTAWRRNFRSACPQGLSAGDIDYARNTLGMTAVIDLRSRFETERQPCGLAGVDGIYYRNIPLFSDYDMDKFGGESYYLMAEHIPSMVELFRTIAGAEGAVLFHCTAGKDRTGITAAILLMLAGVEDIDIVADYQVSRTYIEPLIQHLRKNYPEMPQHTGESPAEYIRDFMARFRERWGTVEGYFDYLGLSDDDVGKLRDRMVG